MIVYKVHFWSWMDIFYFLLFILLFKMECGEESGPVNVPDRFPLLFGAEVTESKETNIFTYKMLTKSPPPHLLDSPDILASSTL